VGCTTEELDWVTRSRNGDDAAFEALVREHRHMVHSLTYRMTGSLADAEDLAQETFIRAFRQLESFNGTARFSSWLYRIAINICLSWRQKALRRDELQQSWAQDCGEDPALPDREPTPHDDVQPALIRLPPKQRAAIVLTIYENLSHSDAARVLGCTEATVSWRVFAARRKLRRWLAPEKGRS
jgi:RNA polymerase sigma-70 factor (ECF subfamily)